MDTEPKENENKINVAGYEDKEMDGMLVRVLYGTIPCTNGVTDFKVEVTGLPENVEEFAAGLVYPRLELVPVDDIEQLRREQQEKGLEMRRQNWHARLDHIGAYIDQATLYQLSDPYLLYRFSTEERKDPAVNDQPFDPTRDFSVIIQPVTEPDPEGLFRFIMQVEHSSPITILAGQSHYHGYRYGRPAENSAFLDVTSGDADIYLIHDGSGVDASLNGATFDEFVYASRGPGTWQVRVYGYTNAAYILSGEWN